MLHHWPGCGPRPGTPPGGGASKSGQAQRGKAAWRTSRLGPGLLVRFGGEAESRPPQPENLKAPFALGPTSRKLLLSVEPSSGQQSSIDFPAVAASSFRRLPTPPPPRFPGPGPEDCAAFPALRVSLPVRRLFSHPRRPRGILASGSCLGRAAMSPGWPDRCRARLGLFPAEPPSAHRSGTPLATAPRPSSCSQHHGLHRPLRGPDALCCTSVPPPHTTSWP